MKAYCRKIVRIGFLRYKSTSLSEWVDDHEEFSFLKLDGWEPMLIGRDLLCALLDVAAIEPEVQGHSLKVKFDANHSRCSSPKLLGNLFFLRLIRYSDLYIIINKQTSFNSAVKGCYKWYLIRDKPTGAY